MPTITLSDKELMRIADAITERVEKNRKWRDDFIKAGSKPRADLDDEIESDTNIVIKLLGGNDNERVR